MEHGIKVWTNDLVEFYMYIDLSYGEAMPGVVLPVCAFNSDKASAWISAFQSASTSRLETDLSQNLLIFITRLCKLILPRLLVMSEWHRHRR